MEVRMAAKLCMLAALLILAACGGSGTGGSDAKDSAAVDSRGQADALDAEGGTDARGDSPTADLALPGDSQELTDATSQGAVTTSLIGPDGGFVEAGTKVKLFFPEGALDKKTTVTVTVYDAVQGDEPLPPIGAWAEVKLDPEPSWPLPKGVLLTFPEGTTAGPGSISRLTALPEPGKVESEDGSELPEEVWVPLQWARQDEEGKPAAVLWSFSSYGQSGSAPADCAPTAEQLTPPPTPEGYEYAGVKVIVNGQMDPATSTLPPLFPPHSGSNISVVSAHTVSQNNYVTCDVLVSHEFVPKGSVNLQCIPPADFMNCAPPPAGYIFVGYDLVINAQLSSSTVDLERAELPSDLNQISSHTEVVNGVTVCDFILRCLYQKMPVTPDPDVVTNPDSTDFEEGVVDYWEFEEDVEVTYTEGGLPPPGDEGTPGEDQPILFNYSIGPSSGGRFGSPIPVGSGFRLYVDYYMSKADPVALLIHVPGADHHLVVKGFELQKNWGEQGQSSVLFDAVLQADASTYVGVHKLRVALAPGDGLSDYDAGRLSEPMDIEMEVSPQE